MGANSTSQGWGLTCAGCSLLRLGGLEGRLGQKPRHPQSFVGGAEQLDLSPGGSRESPKGSCGIRNPGRLPQAGLPGR